MNMRISISIFISVLLTLVLVACTSASEVKLTASDGTVYDRFGESVSITGDYAIVGAPWDDGNGVLSGSAYIYKRNGITWNERAKINASDGAVEDMFGYSVSISGDYAIVGAWGDDDNGENLGSAYIYKRDGTRWNEQAKINASDGEAGEHFGISVSIAGDHAIVGAVDLRQYSDSGGEPGSAYIYKRDGTRWNEQARINASDGEAGNMFGYSVSISGDYAIVGALWDDGNGHNSGSAYIFKYNGTTWNEQAKLMASDGAADDMFGHSVSISDDYVIVGAHRDDDKGINSGLPTSSSVTVSHGASKQRSMPVTARQKMGSADPSPSRATMPSWALCIMIVMTMVGRALPTSTTSRPRNPR